MNLRKQTQKRLDNYSKVIPIISKMVEPVFKSKFICFQNLQSFHYTTLSLWKERGRKLQFYCIFNDLSGALVVGGNRYAKTGIWDGLSEWFMSEVKGNLFIFKRIQVVHGTWWQKWQRYLVNLAKNWIKNLLWVTEWQHR